MSPAKTLCILGESPLVEEYASLCLNKGFKVYARLNAANNHAKLPSGIKRVPKPTKATDIALELTNTSVDAKKKNLVELDRILPPKVPILSSCVTVTTAEQSGWIALPSRLVGLGALPSLLQGTLIELATSSGTEKPSVNAAKEFAKAIGKNSSFVRDSVGLVLPRILCMLANEACFAMMEGVAARRDIDTAMKLGTNYPFGPIEWAENIGLRQVHAVMAALHHEFGEDRYRVAPLLRQAALQDAFPVG
jgi:3-hydroxybutyryl-CoA dehydrogenase